jgi:hypothetical protein
MSFIDLLENLLTAPRLPQQAPMPTPRPSIPDAPRLSPTLPATAPVPTSRPAAPIPARSGLNWQRGLRTAGAGMANLRDTGGDPFMSFGQGFGGAQNYLAGADSAAAAAAAKAEQTAYDRGQDSADLELRRAAEDRQRQASEIQSKKTADEMERLARQNGLTVDQMIQIERIAQAAGEAETNAERRRKVVEAERQRLIKQFGDGEQVGGLTPKAEETAPKAPSAGRKFPSTADEARGDPSIGGLTPERYSEAPRDPAQREVGTVYRAPDGRAVRWMGNGWQLAQ